MTQGILPLSIRPSYGLVDLIIAPHNAMPFETILKAPDLPFNKALLIGERGSGKTHICHAFQKKTNGLLMTRDNKNPLETLSDVPTIAIDQLEQWTSSEDQEYLFHLYNQTHSRFLLLAGNRPLDAIGFTLADLTSRLKTCSVLTISSTVDDIFLTKLLAKTMKDRGLLVSPEIAEYLWHRVERSSSQLMHLLSQIDKYLFSHPTRKLSYMTLKEILS